MEPREYGELGLTSAMARLEDATSRNAESEVLVALSETLHWAYALEDHLANESGDWEEYREKEQNDEAHGAVLAGLIYARNRATHSLDTVAELVDIPWVHHRPGGLRMYGGRRTAPATRQVPRWRPLGALKKPPKRFKGRPDLYEKWVAERDLMEPIVQGTRYLLGPAPDGEIS